MTPESTPAPEKKRRGRPRKNPLPDTAQTADNQPITIGNMTNGCIESLREALQRTEELARERRRQKLSNNRICNVARELKELLKVMTRYCQD